MTVLATPYAKDLWCPILRYRDCCFMMIIPLMMKFLMGVSTTPIPIKFFLGFIRVILIVVLSTIILFGVKWFVENGVLVRQLSRVDQTLRPLLYNPPVDLSWQAIRELLQLHHLL